MEKRWTSDGKIKEETHNERTLLDRRIRRYLPAVAARNFAQIGHRHLNARSVRRRVSASEKTDG
jgi:hypothetical protein